MQTILEVVFGKPGLWRSGRGSTVCVVCPLDSPKPRTVPALEKGPEVRQLEGLGDCVKKIAKSEGCIGVDQGFDVSVRGAAVYQASRFGAYDTVKGL